MLGKDMIVVRPRVLTTVLQHWVTLGHLGQQSRWPKGWSQEGPELYHLQPDSLTGLIGVE